MAPPGVERGVFSAAEAGSLILEVLGRHSDLQIVIVVGSMADAAAMQAAIDALRAGAR
jgi:hypothetical protein